MLARLSRHKFAALYLLLIALITFSIYTHLWKQTPRYGIKEIDIYYSYIDGQRILNGENPYARIMSSDMMKNKKYSTYFPIFFVLSYLAQAAGLRACSESHKSITKLCSDMRIRRSS